MKLTDLAKQLPDDFSEQEFMDLMNQVIDLKTIVELPVKERSALYDGVQYLVDYILLAKEAKGELRFEDDNVIMDYNGPFIPTVLTRPDGAEMDRAALNNSALVRLTNTSEMTSLGGADPQLAVNGKLGGKLPFAAFAAVCSLSKVAAFQRRTMPEYAA